VRGIHPQPGRLLLVGSTRARAGVLLICCALLVVALGVLFAHQTRADWLAQAVDSPVITWLGSHRGLLLWLAAAGSQIPAAVGSAALVLACLVAGRLNGAVLAGTAVLVAVGLDEEVFKPLVHRTYMSAVTYPSGHTTGIVTLAATVTVLLLLPPQPAKSRALRSAIAATAWLLGAVVAIGVIGLRWHYFTDTLAGAAVGIGTVCGLALFLDLPAVRRWLALASRLLPGGSATLAA